MTNLLIKLFIKDNDSNNAAARAGYGTLSGVMGIILNLVLFSAKLTAGILSSSISVTADAFNNLSDAGGSVVTYLGFRLARRPADAEHPFGHGRYEYVAGLGISVVILLVGFELFKSSIDKIINPEDVSTLSTMSIIILIASVLIKLWMFFFNRKLAKIANSATIKAASLDSLTDAAATTIVLVGLVVSKLVSFNIDGYLGVLVALFIFYAGINAMKESISPLLGKAPDAQLVAEIEKTVLEDENVVGIHDLIVHDYGPGRCMISLHAEVPCDSDMLVIHDAIDMIEKELCTKFNCSATIHMDPIAVNDEFTNGLKALVIDKIKEIDNSLSIHDFRVVPGETHTNLIFDVTVPHRFAMTDSQVSLEVKAKVQEINENYFAVVTIDKPFVES